MGVSIDRACYEIYSGKSQRNRNYEFLINMRSYDNFRTRSAYAGSELIANYSKKVDKNFGKTVSIWIIRMDAEAGLFRHSHVNIYTVQIFLT